MSKYVFRYLAASAIFLIALGTIFYHIVEKFTWLDAYYFSVVTLATVGYGDIAPHTAAGKIFTTLYLLAGVGVLTTFLSALVQKRMEKRIPKE